MGNVETFLFIFYMLFLYHRCNCKLYSVTVAMQSVVMESSKNNCDQPWLKKKTSCMILLSVSANKVFKRGLKNANFLNNIS